MIKKGIGFFLLLALILGGILYLASYTGYVTVRFDQWTLQSPLWLSVLALLLFVWLIRLVVRLITSILTTPHRVSKWFIHHRKEQATADTQKGLLKLAQGDWANAEKLLLKSATHQSIPAVNYLAAAQAAQQQGAEDRCEHYLNNAAKSGRDAELATRLFRIQWQLSHNQVLDAQAQLTLLHHENPRNTYVLQLLQHVYLTTENWKKLIDLLPLLKKHRILSKTQLPAFLKKVYTGLLGSTAFQTVGALNDCWYALPRFLKKESNLLALYCRELLTFQEHDRVYSLLSRSLKKGNLNDDLILLYGDVKAKNPQKQYKQAQQWLKQSPHNATLLLTLGRLAKQLQLWGQAKAYLQQSINEQPKQVTYQELAELLEQLNEHSDLLDIYKASVTSALH